MDTTFGLTGDSTKKYSSSCQDIKGRNRRHAKACRERNRSHFRDMTDAYEILVMQRSRQIDALRRLDASIGLLHMAQQKSCPTPEPTSTWISSTSSTVSSLASMHSDHSYDEFDFKERGSDSVNSICSTDVSDDEEKGMEVEEESHIELFSLPHKELGVKNAQLWIESIRAKVRQENKDKSTHLVEEISATLPAESPKQHAKTKMEIRRVRNRVHAKMTRLRSIEVRKRMQSALSDLSKEIEALCAEVKLRYLQHV